ncbi:MAG: hypothetical protein LBQ54_10540 [Planctomycetaceae bacterium]|nr:hypothetical protein [Planctomycetaceae bacterium]
MPPAGRDAAAGGWSCRSESRGFVRVAHWNQPAEKRYQRTKKRGTDDIERRPHQRCREATACRGSRPCHAAGYRTNRKTSYGFSTTMEMSVVDF